MHVEEEQKNISKRWRYYIDKSFQNQFMARFALVIVLVTVATLGVLAVLFENPYDLLPDAGVLHSMEIKRIPQPDGTFVETPVPGKTYNAFELFWKPILFISLLNLIIIVVFSLFYSHSMAGPIHNIKVSLKDLAEGGKPKAIRIRKSDQFQDLAELLNEVIEKRVK
ncbi:MAG TPA: methyl-accepting chemotaxis protein [Leptospiraceae bacterium]|jgi:methyl-accepting chemotaxis protein|nr:methyl-accepting chemotaxis protein [Leptospiraceae bacterium]HNJ34134.1 methyl-accepting chemotaxis protein [Leptospiraceae bacterium]HQI20688.1 methyl-accepting chemotaxis protein [Leptospiraceae bacterium]